MRVTLRLLVIAGLMTACAAAAGHALFAQTRSQLPVDPAPPAPVLKPYVVDYYYKVKWGHFAEFLALYKKNHYPILQRMQREGHILSMSAAYPHNHASEATRWDMRFTIVYRDVLAEHLYSDEALIKELYPDQVKFRQEEQRRFELLLEHLDIPVDLDDLAAWK